MTLLVPFSKHFLHRKDRMAADAPERLFTLSSRSEGTGFSAGLCRDLVLSCAGACVEVCRVVLGCESLFWVDCLFSAGLCRVVLSVCAWLCRVAVSGCAEIGDPFFSVRTCSSMLGLLVSKWLA